MYFKEELTDFMNEISEYNLIMKHINLSNLVKPNLYSN
jgi:hypothetical protein